MRDAHLHGGAEGERHAGAARRGRGGARFALLAALLLCLAVAVLSAFGSSIGTLGIALPLALPLLELGGIGAAGFVVALGFCSTVVDVSPFSTNGIIVLAQARVDDKQRFQRRMLAYGGLVVLVAPVLAWSVAVLPTS
ncbi:Na+/H+ antiporter NhaC family protein [Saccharopolyspora spinosporotrichia]